MSASDWISLGAVVIAVLSLALHLVLRSVDKHHAQHVSVISALQGEKQSVGYEAYRIAEGGWPASPVERRQLRDALCLAFIFEPSDRSRALIIRALEACPEDEQPKIQGALEKITAVFEAAEQRESGWRLHRAWKRLAMLGRLLDLPEVTKKAMKYAS